MHAAPGQGRRRHRQHQRHRGGDRPALRWPRGPASSSTASSRTSGRRWCGSLGDGGRAPRRRPRRTRRRRPGWSRPRSRPSAASTRWSTTPPGSQRGTIETPTPRPSTRVIAVNTRAPLLLIRAALDAARARARGGAEHRQRQRLLRRADLRGLQREQGRAHDPDPQPRRHPPPRARRAGQPDQPRVGAHRGREAGPGEAGQPARLVREAPEGVGALRPPHPPRGDRRRRRLLDRRREPAHQRQRGGARRSSRSSAATPRR